MILMYYIQQMNVVINAYEASKLYNTETQLVTCPPKGSLIYSMALIGFVFSKEKA